MALPASTRLGPYEIIAAIGAGGMGEVYRARDLRLNREVAVKILLTDTSDHPDRRTRFEREARAVAVLNHPNIVSIFDFGEESGVQYTVSELVIGDSLRTLLRHGALPARKILDIGVQIADGLAAAHSAGIAHRDLKPENIMITKEGRAKILDFGLARQTNPIASGDSDDLSTLSMHMTQPGTVLGTANYMSPEQARGANTDYRSDQFSFGLILYELASGKRAFSKESTVETLAAIVKEEPLALDAKLPPPLRWVIDRCLIKDPRQRYESTRDLYHELRSLRDHLSDAFSSTSIEPVKAARTPRHSWKWIAIPSAIVSVAAVAALLTRDVGVDLSRHRYTPFALNPEVLQEPVWSPDGKAVAYTGRVNGHDQAFVRYLDSPVPKQLTTNRESARPTRWSPDGKRILYFAPGLDSTEAKPTRALFSIAVVGGEPEHLAAIPDNLLLNSISGREEVSPDGETVAFFGRLKESDPITVFISSPPGSPYRQYEPAPFASKVPFNSTRLRFSPNGKNLLLTRTGDSNSEETWLLPYPPGQSAPHHVLTRFPQLIRTRDSCWMPDNRHVALALVYSEKTKDSHIWIADTESDDSYQITEGTNAQSSVAMSPNAKQMVFSELKYDLDIASVSLIDGKATRLIASDVRERMAAWAAKTNKLAYVTNRNGPSEIWVRSSEGSDLPLVTERSFPGSVSRFFMNPVPSPDGERVVFTRQSPDGQTRTWIMSSSGGAPERLSALIGAEYAGTWSPDGRHFAERVDSTSGGSLVLIKVGSREKPVVLRKTGQDFLPDWSPTGEWLTFLDESGWNLISPDGKTVKPLGRIASAHLSFSKDGKLLYGIREEKDKTTLFSLDVATLRVTDIHELGRELAPATDYYPGVRFSLTPDGRSITYSTATTKSSLWLLEGFRQPGLLSRLGLNWWER